MTYLLWQEIPESTKLYQVPEGIDLSKYHHRYMNTVNNELTEEEFKYLEDLVFPLSELVFDDSLIDGKPPVLNGMLVVSGIIL